MRGERVELTFAPGEKPPCLCGRSRKPDTERTRLMAQELKSSHELIKALKLYLDETGETEGAVASRMVIDRHSLHRWLFDAPAQFRMGDFRIGRFGGRGNGSF